MAVLCEMYGKGLVFHAGISNRTSFTPFIPFSIAGPAPTCLTGRLPGARR